MEHDLSLEKRASLKNFFTIDRGVKVIIEGGYQSGWNDLHLDATEFVIPEDTASIILRKHNAYTLTMHVGNDYCLGFVEDAEKTLRLKYSLHQGIQMPRGLLVEDGRFFYDQDMYRDQPEHVRQFLHYLEQQYREGVGFHNLHERIVENKLRKHEQPYF
ncbi:hypothetical protein GF367_00390 [Candidatus Woesearchaeota archaeon]|nr:hypothetical protein [Candidatus Woesearchaeota archaeon]